MRLWPCSITPSLFFFKKKTSSEDNIHFLIPPNLSQSVLSATLSLLAPANLPPAPTTPSPIKWITTSSFDTTSTKPILTLELPQSSGLPRHLAWHRRGDYLASVCKYIEKLEMFFFSEGSLGFDVLTIRVQLAISKALFGYTKLHEDTHKLRSGKSKAPSSSFSSTHQNLISSSR